ncbi:MAG: MFS transporter [Denitrovibrio sp.]|nr:MAG: MFS transporter [Denitrovibrio sp.]
MKLISILLTGLLLFSSLYGPQPVYPVLIEEFGIASTQVALLQTATFIPLTLSPIIYGFIVDKRSPLKMLQLSLLLLAIGEIFFAISTSFYMLLAARFFQGLFIPAGMISVVSYISTTYHKDNVQKYIAYYMASTMAGGVAGRVLVGFFSTIYGWRISFVLLGISVFACYIVTMMLKNNTSADQTDHSSLKDVLRQGEYVKPIFTVFFAFIVFSSIMNFYSIRLRELSPDLNEFYIGVAYIGSLFGSVTAYMTPRFASVLGSYKRTIISSFVIMLVALGLFRIPTVTTTIATLFLFCGAFIVIHSSCSGLLNKYATVSKGSVNGVYFTVYYFGGVIGTSIPGFIYKNSGWNTFLLILTASTLIGLTLALFSKIETQTTE